MQLIGMLDSPYVRRVAISLQLLGLPFEHRSISVFRGVDEFKRINPVVKAPSLVCDDGEVLMDSTLILDYAEALAAGRKSLMPSDVAARQHALHTLGLALAACEKAVQIVYERALRPPEKRHEPWVTRVTGQLNEALRALNARFAQHPQVPASATIDQAGLSAAVAWQFTHLTLPTVVAAADFPALHAYTLQAESLPEFQAAPRGEGTYRARSP